MPGVITGDLSHEPSMSLSLRFLKENVSIPNQVYGRVYHEDPFLNQCFTIILTAWNALHPVRRLLKRVSPTIPASRSWHQLLDTFRSRHTMSDRFSLSLSLSSNATNAITRVWRTIWLSSNDINLLGWLIFRLYSPRCRVFCISLCNDSYLQVFRNWTLWTLSVLWSISETRVSESNFFFLDKSLGFRGLLSNLDFTLGI